MDCPRKSFIRTSQRGNPQRKFPAYNNVPGTNLLPDRLELTNNFVNLQKIICNSGVTVPILLLAAQETVSCEVDAVVCTHNKSTHNGLVCYFDHKLYAYIYISTEINDAFIKHYIIAFIEGTKIGRYKDTIDLLYRTVLLLKLQNERPYFFIYYYGKQPPFETNLDDARKNITRALRKDLPNYKANESFCTTRKVTKNAPDFIIYDSNPYRFTVS